MRILGLEITRSKALGPVSDNPRAWHRILEPYAGAWQQNQAQSLETTLSHHAIFACTTLIARDIAKLRIKLNERGAGDVWTEKTRGSPYLGILRKPNGWQTRIQFVESWLISKQTHGNAYILKRRDNREFVNALYVLDPSLVRPLVSDNGEVYYRLSRDNLSSLTDDIIVPASEIIHDRYNCLFHPLVGLSPIYAAGLAATQGINIQQDSTAFFGNRSLPGGVLTAPGAISQETADRLKTAWETNYGGTSAGKIAVLGDNLKFEQMRVTATDSQVIEQLKWTAEMICSAYHVPPYKIGVGPMQTAGNVQSLNVEYYSQALQSLIEDVELCLREGLGMASSMDVQFDLDGLLRMDSKTQMETLGVGIEGRILSTNDARAKVSLPPTEGGDAVLAQQQNYSLAALADRDADKPFSKPVAPQAEPPSPEEVAAGVAVYLQRELAG